MADTPHGPGPRVVRLSVSRPATTAASALLLGGALLFGGGAASGPPSSAGATASPTETSEAAVGSSRADDWDVTQRDLLVGQRRAGALDFVQVVQTRLGAPLVVTGSAVTSADRAVPPLVGPTQVPEVLWRAYRSAASSVPTACHLPVGLLAAIGQVESGSLAGRGLDSRHRAVPAVLGPVLDGHGYAAIPDTDGGRWDHDTTWDRAVGPMQFIPSTWARWGRDGSGDGTSDPQNVEDSAWSAAAYLCAGGRDLATAPGLRSAILSYNHSAAYLADVLRLAPTMTPGGAVPQVAAAPATTTGSAAPTTATTTATATATRPSSSSSSSTDTGTSPTTRPPSTTTTTSPTASTTSPTSSETSSATSSTTSSPTTTPSSSSTTCPTPSSPTSSSPTTSASTSGSSTTASPSSSSSPTTATPDPCATSSTTTSATTTATTTTAATTGTATANSTEGPSGG